MYNSTHTSNENINTLRQPLIDRINQILLSIPIDQFTDVTDTIFNLLKRLPSLIYRTCHK